MEAADDRDLQGLLALLLGRGWHWLALVGLPFLAVVGGGVLVVNRNHLLELLLVHFGHLEGFQVVYVGLNLVAIHWR